MANKLFETRIIISVLSTGKPYTFSSYENLAYDVIEGDYSGAIVSEESREMTKEEFETKCAEHGSDPEFFGEDWAGEEDENVEDGGDEG